MPIIRYFNLLKPFPQQENWPSSQLWVEGKRGAPLYKGIFKDFIEKELIPYVNQTYRTSNERALSGHSQGGLFATWMMLNHPSIFKKYIILGPSLWVEKGQMIKQANKLQASAEITAYFAVGSKEYDANRSMVDEVKLFYSDLPKNKNFKSNLEIIDDENHVSMVPAALTKGFKFLFGK